MNQLVRRMEYVKTHAEQMAKERKITLSLVLEELTSGQQVVLADHMAHSSASTIKVPLMMAVLEEEGRGFSFSDVIELSSENAVDFSVVVEMEEGSYTVKEYLQWMMLESCNASTNVLIDLVGWDRVNRIFNDLGMTETVLQRKMMDTEARAKVIDNMTCASDMATLLRAIYRREYFKEDPCQRAIELMKRCRDTRLLKRFLPRNIEFAHKTGGLDEVSHDVGIFFAKKDILVAAMTTSAPGEEMQEMREKIIGHIGRWLLKEEI